VLVLAIAPRPTEAALICESGHLHYGRSEFYANRLQAVASLAPHQGGYLWCYACCQYVPRKEAITLCTCHDRGWLALLRARRALSRNVAPIQIIRLQLRT
jgi:hypothetical protein